MVELRDNLVPFWSPVNMLSQVHESHVALSKSWVLTKKREEAGAVLVLLVCLWVFLSQLSHSWVWGVGGGRGRLGVGLHVLVPVGLGGLGARVSHVIILLVSVVN